ncbi:GNAT family N-acetyltransferase [Sphingorhabdus arenilitoris]|uniref:GNAT family N-acetyltransferase n=1 Tax=Sphingorhabdus arenilitoris TaxID=1490041 RepID=A0ABV8RJR9_9SPHN
MFARTERLLLRPSWPEDAEALHRAACDEAIARNLAMVPWPYTLDDARSFAALDQDPLYPNFLLLQRTDGAPRIIGSCGLVAREGGAEIGYWIARPYWGLGYASEAARAVVSIARAIGHRRLISGHFTDNPASGRVLRKIGFRPTGEVVLRHSAGRGSKVPCALYEMPLAEEDGFAGRDYDAPDPVMPYDAQPMAA